MKTLSMVFMGATGAVGSAAFNQLLTYNEVAKIMTLGRWKVKDKELPKHVEQHIIEIHKADSYSKH